MSAERPILYTFRRCPYAIRARLAIGVGGVDVEMREVDLRDKPQAMLDRSPKGTVPVLQLADGSAIDESLDIMRWALGHNDPENWLASDETELIQQNDGPFKSALDRYKYPHRYGLKDDASHRDVGLAFLLQLDGKLEKQSFLTAEMRSLTDIAIFPFIRQFAATDQAWFDAQPLPALHGWLGQLLTSDLYTSIMHRYPQWRAGDIPTIFP